MSEDLKDNCCGIIFHCDENRLKKDCLHRKNKRKCKYLGDYNNCTDTVAQVNRMFLHAKHIGLELTAEGIKLESAK